MLIQHMSLDVKDLETAREAVGRIRNRLLEEGDRQLVDATVAMIDEQLMLMESDD